MLLQLVQLAVVFGGVHRAVVELRAQVRQRGLVRGHLCVVIRGQFGHVGGMRCGSRCGPGADGCRTTLGGRRRCSRCRRVSLRGRRGRYWRRGCGLGRSSCRRRCGRGSAALLIVAPRLVVFLLVVQIAAANLTHRGRVVFVGVVVVLGHDDQLFGAQQALAIFIGCAHGFILSWL